MPHLSFASREILPSQDYFTLWPLLWLQVTQTNDLQLPCSKHGTRKRGSPLPCDSQAGSVSLQEPAPFFLTSTVSSQHLYAVWLFVSPLWESFQLTNPAKIPRAAGRFPLSEWVYSALNQLNWCKQGTNHSKVLPFPGSKSVSMSANFILRYS